MLPINSFFFDFQKRIEELSGYEKERFVNIFWQKVSSMRCPLIFRDEVIFLTRNRYENVELLGDINNWKPGSHPMRKMTSTDITFLPVELPHDAAVEYKMIIGGNYTLDLLNPTKSRGQLGENSLLKMPYYHENEELNYQENPGGQLLDFVLKSKHLGYFSTVYVYLPNDFNPETRYDYLIFLDGHNYLQYGSIVTVLDNLFHRKKFHPCLAFFVESRDYTHEFSCNPDYPLFFFEELLPMLHEKFLLTSDRNNLVIGEAMAGIAVLQIFLSSSSFDAIVQSVPLGHLKDYFFHLFAEKGRSLQRLILQSGTFETSINGVDIFRETRELSNLIKEAGNFKFIPQFFPEGHSWHNWSNHLIDAMMKMKYDVF
ncbi:MAG: alpha/beta hydrolase-fold protein [Candidatus Wallbacteria bacterium]|nr:alpha/beta hydrolase-fold protein [Candidatus Wallbacteria bacterium]